MKQLGMLAIAIVALVGCSRISQQASSAKSQKPEQVEQSSPRGKHVFLSPTDLAKELQQHCGKAHSAMQELTNLLNNASQTSDPAMLRRFVQQAQAPAAEASQNMQTCMTMVHGMQEQHLGEPSTGNQRPTKSD